MPRRRYATAAGGGASGAPAGQPEVLKMLDKTIGNKWFLHLALPLVVSLNGWAHLHAVIPADTYWLPAAYWTYSFRASLPSCQTVLLCAGLWRFPRCSPHRGCVL